MFEITPIPIYKDNYVWMMTHGEHAWVIDPGDAEPVLDTLRRRHFRLQAVLITHKHWDHVDGLPALLERFEVPVFGPAATIRGVSNVLGDGDTLKVAGQTAEVIAVPGHTAEHIAYYLPEIAALFCGDTLFSAGCGRVFDGTVEQLFASLKRLQGLPGDTRVYPAHEYTLANLNFAEAVEPGNADRNRYWEQCRALRQSGRPTLPASLTAENAINPFLRTDRQTVKTGVEAHFQTNCYSEFEVFRLLRKWKDTF